MKAAVKGSMPAVSETATGAPEERPAAAMRGYT